jgi:hypothetical protein
VDTNVKNFEFSGKMKQTAIILIVLGIVGTVASFSVNKTVAWVDYLVNNLYFITIAVSGIFFMSVAGVLQASWTSPFRRIMEAYASYIPMAIVLMIPVCFGIHTLYEWSHMDIVNNDPILVQKKPWLNETFFIIRMFLYLGLWTLILWSQKKLSREQDESGNPLVQRNTRNSAIHMIIFGFSICFAAFDWIMSVEPHWFSTIFGVYIFAGCFTNGIAFTILCCIQLQKWGYLKNIITDDHYHDLGKWLFGISVFWAYIWISQYLLIWYANIPEETEYFVLRQDHWGFAFFANLVINFLIPFLFLMKRGSKRNKKILAFVASCVLFGHFVDLYVMVAPKVFHHAHVHITGYGVLQLLQWCGFAGIFLFIVGRTLASNKLLNTGDPHLEEGLHLHQ